MKNYFLILILILFTQCGYNPIFSQNNQNFNIKEIEFNKNKNNKILDSRLKNFQNRSNTLYSYNLKFKTSEKQSALSKDKQGKDLLLRMEISLDLKVFEKEKMIMEKKYLHHFDYQNMSKKFELSNYEDEIRVNIYNEIISKILMDLENLK